MSLLGNIKTKLATYRLKDYEPPEEFSPTTLDIEWNTLLKAEAARSTKINQKIREYVHPSSFVTVIFTNHHIASKSSSDDDLQIQPMNSH